MPTACHSKPAQGGGVAGVRWAWLGPSDTALNILCVIRPLGSPWTPPNWSYVHVPVTGYHAGVRVQHLRVGEGSTRGWCKQGGWGGVVPTWHPPSTPHWYCQGPTTGRTCVSAPAMALQGPAGTLPHTMAPRTQYSPLRPIRARFHV